MTIFYKNCIWAQQKTETTNTEIVEIGEYNPYGLYKNISLSNKKQNINKTIIPRL